MSQTRLRDDLRISTVTNDVVRLRRLLEEGCDVNAVDESKRTPLYLAVEKDALEAAKILIEADANVDAVASSGFSPLHIATEQGQLEMTKTLIEAGANVNAIATNGDRPLHIAAKSNASAMAEILIRAGANVDALNLSEERPLHIAAENDASTVAKILMEAGANVEATSSHGSNFLQLAASHNASDTAKALIDGGADLEAMNSEQRRPLHIAASFKASETTKTLIDAGAVVDATDVSDKTPLHYAAERKDNVKTVRVLLAAGADLQVRDNQGRTPLCLATNKGFRATALAMLEEADRRAALPPELRNQRKREKKASDGGLSHHPAPASRALDDEHTAAVFPIVQNPPSVDSQVQCNESPKGAVLVLQLDKQTEKEHEDSTEADSLSDSDSSCTSEEETDVVKAVQSLKEGDIFAENYCVERKLVIGKPLTRIAKLMRTSEDVILKFYLEPEFYSKALSSYESLSKSNYICKPIDKIRVHQDFPDCLVFKKGVYTLDEWMRLPDLTLASRIETLQLVAIALYDLHSCDVVHCNVKPSNLAFFPAENKWKLMNVESARKVEEVADVVTTISHASPELLEAVKEDVQLSLHPSIDMWAYGIIAFEVLTGKQFYRQESTVESVLDFLRSPGFKQRLAEVEDRKHRRFVERFLKWNASERRSAHNACTSSVLEPATVSVSGSRVVRR